MENDFFSYGFNNKNLPSFLDEKTTQGMIGRMQSYKNKGLYDAFKKEDTDKDKDKFTRFAGELAKGGFQPYDENKEYMKSLLNRPFGGGAIPGSTQRLAGGLTMTTPAAFEPIITPGGGGYQGRSTGQRIAGAASGALSGFQAGAATGIPHLAGIGAVVGGIGGLFG
tara:strand:+ start:953 stop:1453 length:501 start_codon:yes stop_codon:yes gene_type:complete